MLHFITDGAEFCDGEKFINEQIIERNQLVGLFIACFFFCFFPLIYFIAELVLPLRGAKLFYGDKIVTSHRTACIHQACYFKGENFYVS